MSTTELAHTGMTHGVTLQDHVASVGRRLAGSLERLLEAVPGGPHQPLRLARELNINKDLASRTLMATRAKDPIVVVQTVPGPRPLRTLLQAVESRGVDAALIADAEQAVAEFDALIQEQLGDRTALDAVIADWLPDARAKAELLSKQAAFRGMRHLKGVEVDTCLQVQFVHPSDDPDFVDIIHISGLFGLRRLRPSAIVKLLEIMVIGGSPEGMHTATLAGNELKSIDSYRSLALADFCERPNGEFQVIESPSHVRLLLSDGAVGLSRSVDHVFAMAIERAGPRQNPKGTRRGIGGSVTMPARLLVDDVFVADGTVAGPPTLAIYDTSIRGLAHVTDRSRDVDLYNVLETNQPLGRGFAGCRLAEVPRYVQLLEHVARVRGWNPASFTGYRCRVDFPIFGSQIAQIFEQPRTE